MRSARAHIRCEGRNHTGATKAPWTAPIVLSVYETQFRKTLPPLCNLGGDIRAVLRDKVGLPTIPQIFVAGQHLGGATETFDAFNSGDLQKRLIEANVPYDKEMSADAYSFLPSWLHPR